jgi:uncharacterized protein
MKFEWDEKKRRANLEKHGIDFAEAAEIFSGPIMTQRDVRRDYQEGRGVALGRLKDLVVYLAYTRRGESIRLISLRQANRKERKLYEETFKD